ncbi:pantoate--beta-alanine ligase [Lamprobacter modestohalophilus]|uniref:pantoate--beta-alanine ligase n=1 Tax=Lamprobacter modestohalophilus TaxID=1064514 RepID=UPI002ADEFAB2|nr:pantoate--beta-alanine ligase [Lamprobacter modestohalophilus]MCF7980049.1 pantoate--beta-alanine ligase [Chromatiaceae bacterium]MCF7995897.1 pantoate--beta-alanine ligase [Chromatiaceae bacterium]MCF8003982.1 pantoate--beta-alanine ligase [Chromatiaceae bacterium]MCF8014559.1 pantoate--beta-alanine ligase [Chromatiaceae bacterium]MEA1051446.1 pantoate--beta-alanine ligase [Lamprobacter modestohalophilus]
MQFLDQLRALRRQRAEWRQAGLRVGLVPTMGNLHAGHLSLIRAASEAADRVVATVFVNPLQFGAGEDFAAYPRTLERDSDMLRDAGCDLLFAPADAEVYPRGRDQQTFVEVPGLSDQLCGASRPGHFRGVATVVAKLFNMVQPEVAIFGEKDFQQLLVIRRMVEDLNLPVEVVGAPIVREPDGLAMSSRNGYLSAAERALAPRLRASLITAAARLRSGANFAEVEQDAQSALAAAGFEPDYVSVRRRADLAEPEPDTQLGAGTAEDRALMILAAAQLGRARLIDNLACDLDAPLAELAQDLRP